MNKITKEEEIKDALIGPSFSAEAAAYFGVSGSYLGNGRFLILKGLKTNAGVSLAISVSGYAGKRDEI